MASTRSASTKVQDAVVVQLNLVTSSGSDAENLRLSCSGVILNHKTGLVISSGLIFAPLFQSKRDTQDEDQVQHERLERFFGPYGKLLQRTAGKTDRDSDSGNELLDYIENQCMVNVYSQNVLYEVAEKCQSVATSPVRNVTKTLWSYLISNSKELKKKTNILQAATKKSWVKRYANVLAIWRCPALANILEAILSSSTSGWSLTAEESRTEVHSQDVEKQTRNLLPFFVLLQLKKPEFVVVDDIINTFKFCNPFERGFVPFLYSTAVTAAQSSKVLTFLSHQTTDQNKENDSKLCLSDSLPFLTSFMKSLRCPYNVGDEVFLMATPFGSLSPNVFLNSVSKGILANVAGEDDILIMTDARCVPGCEGGAIYLETQPKKRQLVGVVVAPFCWRQNEWVGLTFGCSLRPLLTSLFDAVSGNGTHETSDSITIKNSPSSNEIASNMRTNYLVRNVALIKVGSRWGSGVLVRLPKDGQRFLVTCCHVTQKPAGTIVKVRFGSRALWAAEEQLLDAKIIYSTPAGQVYDVAVLEFAEDDNCSLPEGLDISREFANEGDAVLAVGHGLFDLPMHLPASVTSGIISKIIKKNGKQVLIQSTCAVHPGASGGALVKANTNQLCGIIVCNTKDAICGASYPHVNLSIPSFIVMSALKDYKTTGDLKSLNRLHNPDPEVASFWQLGYNQIGKLQCKL